MRRLMNLDFVKTYDGRTTLGCNRVDGRQIVRLSRQGVSGFTSIDFREGIYLQGVWIRAEFRAGDVRAKNP